MIRVLFVCLGNICRSPMAEAVKCDIVVKQGLENQIAVDSAASSSWHIGYPPHRVAINKLSEYGISTKGMVGCQLCLSDYDEFDYIIGMDDSNIQNIYSK